MHYTRAYKNSKLIKQIIKHLENSEYEKASSLSTIITDSAHSSEDALFCQWAEAVIQFMSYEHNDFAMELLKKIEPTELNSFIDFKIINALLCIYMIKSQETKFIEYAELLILNIHKLYDLEYKIRILSNIAHGYLNAKNYNKAMIYADRCTILGNTHNIYTLPFSVAYIVKIMCFYYCDRESEALLLKEKFLKFLLFTGNSDHKEYLDKVLRKFKQ